MKDKKYSIKDICRYFNIHRNTFYKHTKDLINVIKIKTNNKRQCLFSMQESIIIIDLLKKSLKKYK